MCWSREFRKVSRSLRRRAIARIAAERFRWYQNVPVLSYIALGGKCGNCRQPISIRYPAIELLTGLICVAALYRYGLSWSLLVRDIPFIVILVAITFIDLEHRIIPNVLSLGGTALGLATSALDPRLGGGSHGLALSAIGAGVGFGIFYIFAWLYYRATSRSGLGGWRY